MFEEKGEVRERRLKEAQARARAAGTRRAILDLLSRGPLSVADLRAKLPEDASLSVVNYHLGVLVNAREVVEEGGLYRLA